LRDCGNASITRGIGDIAQPAQNGRDVRRAAQCRGEMVGCQAARIRAVCAFLALY
jgi:hypothetical protein